jgi:hypothetical protein
VFALCRSSSKRAGVGPYTRPVKRIDGLAAWKERFNANIVAK